MVWGLQGGVGWGVCRVWACSGVGPASFLAGYKRAWEKFSRSVMPADWILRRWELQRSAHDTRQTERKQELPT